MATFTVTEQAATGAGSLAEAIAAAQASAGPDRIVFAASVTRIVTSATLTIDSNLVIDGDRNNDGMADVTISSDIDVDGTGNHTLFALGTGANVTFDGLVFTKGFDAGTSADDIAVGAIINNGTATIKNSQFLENQAVGWAGTFGANGTSASLSGEDAGNGGAAVGAILNRGTMSVQNTRFADNSGLGGDGGNGGDGAPQYIMIGGKPFLIGGGGGGGGGNGAYGAGAILNTTTGSLTLSGVELDDNIGRAGNGGSGGQTAFLMSGYGGVGGDGAHGSASILDFGSMSGTAGTSGGSFSGGAHGKNSDHPPELSDEPADGVGGLQPTRIGTAGNDARTGFAFSDIFAGLSGDDSLVASGGSDMFNGGTGIDTVVFSAVTAGVTFNLSLTTAQSIGIGKLTIVDVENATGGSGDDSLVGSGGANTLRGMAGNDTLNSAGGGDTLIGGAGNDFYHVNASDTIVELAGEGSDTVNAHESFVLAAGVRVERLQVNNPEGVFARDLTGNEFAQTIVGGAGINVLKGGGGNDMIYGLAGSDTMQGDAGNDTFFVDNIGDFIIEAIGGGTGDIVASSITYALNADAEIEALRTTSNAGTAAINLTGNVFAQTITGNAGANVLSDGGTGKADTMAGLGGNDTYRVYNAGDVIVEGATQGTADRVAAAVDYKLGTGVLVEVMTTNGATGKSGIDLTGNEFVQSITGNAGDNRLEGRGGADTLSGLGGKDTFVFATKLGGGNVDTVTDFNVAADRFLLSDAIFTTLNTGTLAPGYFRSNTTGLAQDANDHIIYERDTGELYYDSNGSAAGGAVLFAKIAVGLALTNADFSVA